MNNILKVLYCWKIPDLGNIPVNLYKLYPKDYKLNFMAKGRMQKKKMEKLLNE